MSTLNSKIILAKNIALDRDYINVLNYTTDKMLQLIQSQEHFVKSAENYEFIRPQDTIFVNFTYEECLKSNYIAFQNTDYSGQWFFAWIDEVKFVNPRSMWNIIYNRCMVYMVWLLESKNMFCSKRTC